MAPTRIELLGEVAVTHAGVRHEIRGVQPRTVAALLVDRRGRSLSRDEVATVLWPEGLPDHWAGAVRGVLSKVRSALGAAADDDPTAATIRTTQDGWRLDLGASVGVDVDDALADLARAEGLASAARWTGAVATANQLYEQSARALALGFAPGAAGEWVERRRNETELAALRAWRGFARTALALGSPHDAISAIETVRERDPYDESAARLHMRALATLGDRPAAMQVHDELVTRLRDELSVEPEDATTAAFERIRRGGPTPAGSVHRIVARAPLVGRDDELERLRVAWSTVRELGRSAAVVVLGEPGAGKTRLVDELRFEVDRDGGATRWGVCSREATTSFGPILSALPGPLAPVPLDATGSIAAPFGIDRSLVPIELTNQLLDIVESPTLFVLDDLQWADPDTRALLAHLAEALSERPLLWVFTTRTMHGELDGLVESLSRRRPMEVIELPGLDPAAVASLLGSAGVNASEALASLVHERTGGNPFFVEELSTLVDSHGTLDPGTVPETLRRWMEHRVAELDESPADLLLLASIVGMNLDVELLASVLEDDVFSVVRRCEVLVDRRWLVEHEDGSLSFRHALTRDALEASLGSARRTLLHRRVADALAERDDTAPATLAEHLAAAGPDRSEQALAAMIDAGEHALAGGAWAMAANWFDRARALAGGDIAGELRAAIGAGRAHRGLGDRTAGRRSLDAAVRLATEIDDHRALAAATLALVGGGARGVCDQMPDSQRAEMIESALVGLGEADSDLAVPLELELAVALILTDHVDRRRALIDDALRRARDLGRDDLLAEALLGSRVVMIEPDTDAARNERTAEALQLARRSSRSELELAALVGLHEDALVRGDREQARQMLVAAAALADRYDHPYWCWVSATWEVLGKIIDGELDAAESNALAAMELQAEHPEAIACFGVNLVDIRLYQGRSAEVVDLLRSAADDNPQIPCYRAVLALCLAKAGRVDEAARQHRYFADLGFANIPEDSNRLLTLVVLADVAATIDDPAGATTLLSLLEPHRHRHAVLNCFGGGGAYWGPVATQLDRLAALIGTDAVVS